MTKDPKFGPGPKVAGWHQANASTAWGQPPPAWINALAQACDDSSLARIGAKIGYSGAALSQAINHKYPGDMDAVRAAVCAHLVVPPKVAP